MGFEKDLTPEKALIFRITHRRNLPWVFDNGIHCRSSAQQDQGFVSIGNQELIEGRKERTVPMEPSGVLSDYIPFYFTPYSPMLLNIVTGRNVPQRPKADIVILVSSLHKVSEAGIRFLFTDRHAYLFNASFSNDLRQLANMVPWEFLQARDFRKDPEDPAKSERYQAEALIHRHLPVDALLGVVTYNDRVKAEVQALAAERQLNLGIHSKPSWFF